MSGGNPMRKRGTSHESWLVTTLRAAGHYARRLAEGGTSDEGDIEAVLAGARWIIEAKFRSSLNIQETLGKTRAKAARAAGHPVPVAVVWKRLVKAEGYKTRQPVAGERVVVALSLADFLALVAQAAAVSGSGSDAQHSSVVGDGDRPPLTGPPTTHLTPTLKQE